MSITLWKGPYNLLLFPLNLHVGKETSLESFRKLAASD